MWEIFLKGGPFMWPLLVCSIAAGAIVFERLWTLQEKRVIPHELTEQVWKWLQANQVNDKLIGALEQNSPLGKVLSVGLANRARPREILIERLQDTGRHVVHELERFIGTLGMIASLSPLMGLLGTVTGMIRTFNAITTAGVGNPTALAGGIAEALICTAAGLAVAIPATICYRLLRGRVERLVVAMEKEAMKLVQAIEAQPGVRVQASAHSGSRGAAA